MWDRDAFFQKDFLGCITFNVDDLKKYSRDTNVSFLDNRDSAFDIRVKKSNALLLLSYVILF